MIHRRPIGLICLAFMAALFSPVLAYIGVILFVNVIPLFRHDPQKPDYYPLGYVLILIAGVCLLIAAWIAVVTAVDLWRLRKRGRSLVLTGALILGIFTLLADARSKNDFWMLTSIQLLSVGAMIYLYLPNIRARFESQASAQGNS